MGPWPAAVPSLLTAGLNQETRGVHERQFVVTNFVNKKQIVLDSFPLDSAALPK